MVIKKRIYITPFKAERTLHIYLPDDYEKAERRYPVMYMFDGHNLFSDSDATFGKSWGLADYMKKSGRQMIIAGLECNHEGNKRLEEFSPYDFKDFDGNIIHGRGKILFDWMVKELKPYVDMNFRTHPQRICTGIGGSSMGGLMAFYGAIRHNDVFSRAACLSSSFMLCAADMEKEFDDISSLYPDSRIYLSWGSAEARSKNNLVKLTGLNLRIAHMASEKGADVYPYMQEKGGHCEADWEKQNGIYMPYLWD